MIGRKDRLERNIGQRKSERTERNRQRGDWWRVK
jgi:hypothetical protein